MKVITETYLVKVIPETYLMKVIPETYLMKVITEIYLMKVITGNKKILRIISIKEKLLLRNYLNFAKCNKFSEKQQIYK